MSKLLQEGAAAHLPSAIAEGGGCYSERRGCLEGLCMRACG
jgi:hypothetical protein